jgi:hypothetical protein
MTISALLMYTDSSSRRHGSDINDTLDAVRQASVLEIEDNLCNNDSTLDLILFPIRQCDPKRTLIQTWTFHDGKYACIGQTQICIQQFGELKEMNQLVLGSRRFDEQRMTLRPLLTMHI